jgi:CelD/BcsL family acetyltransferase involved in cellulose biosynthesis
VVVSIREHVNTRGLVTVVPGEGASTSALPRVEVRSSLDELAPTWDDLVASSARPSPFLRSWWLAGIHAHRPRFVLVLLGDELIGGLALEEDHRPGVQRLRFLGAGFAADHLDAIAAPRHTDAVQHALRGWLGRSGSRMVELDGVDDGSLVGQVVPPNAVRVATDVAPWATLPESFDEYWRARPSKLRSTVKRATQRLAREGARYERMVSAQADVAVRDFVALHHGRWGGESALEPLLARFERVARTGLERGELVAHRFVHGDDAIAIELWLELRGIASFYQSGRSLDHEWRGVGSVLKARVVEDACERGVREIDLLRGDEPYKRDWTDERRTLFTITSVQGLRARAARALFEVARTGRRALKAGGDRAR